MKFVCPVCGYVYEGDSVPEGFKCPLCGAAGEKFIKQEEGMTWASEHVVGVAKDVDPEILQGLRDNFAGECSEVGMYLAMARVAHREGYPEIGLYWEKAAYEEAEHAAKFAELLGEVVTDSTKKNLEMRVEAALPSARPSLQSLQRQRVSTLSTTQSMRWLATRRDTARLLQDFSRDTSANNSSHKNHTHSRRTSNGVRRVIFI